MRNGGRRRHRHSGRVTVYHWCFDRAAGKREVADPVWSFVSSRLKHGGRLWDQLRKTTALRIVQLGMLVAFWPWQAQAVGEGGVEPQTCLECHGALSPKIISAWQKSKHAARGVGCAGCHGNNHASIFTSQGRVERGGLRNLPLEAKQGVRAKPPCCRSGSLATRPQVQPAIPGGRGAGLHGLPSDRDAFSRRQPGKVQFLPQQPFVFSHRSPSPGGLHTMPHGPGSSSHGNVAGQQARTALCGPGDQGSSSDLCHLPHAQRQP